MVRHLRAAIFVAGAGFIVLGPAYPQVFLGPNRSYEQPWLPMAWQMYHSIGTQMCQATFWSLQNGVRVEIPRERLETALARKRGNGRYGVGRRLRDNDALFTTEADLPEIAAKLCADDADVRAYARCAPAQQGKWKIVADGDNNLCRHEDVPAIQPKSSKLPSAESPD